MGFAHERAHRLAAPQAAKPRDWVFHASILGQSDLFILLARRRRQQHPEGIDRENGSCEGLDECQEGGHDSQRPCPWNAAQQCYASDYGQQRPSKNKCCDQSREPHHALKGKAWAEWGVAMSTMPPPTPSAKDPGQKRKGNEPSNHAPGCPYDPEDSYRLNMSLYARIKNGAGERHGRHRTAASGADLFKGLHRLSTSATEHGPNPPGNSYACVCLPVPQIRITMDFMPLMKSIPSPVDDCSRAVLEWDRFLQLLTGYSVSSVGKTWILGLSPSTDSNWLNRQHSLVEEMRLLLGEGAQPGLGSLFDPIDLLNKSRIEGAALEAVELRDLLNLADDISGWVSLLRLPPERVQGRIPELKALSAPLLISDLHPLVDSLRTKILPDGTLTDDASPELRRIRREMERQQRSIEESLRSALRRLSEGGSTQDDLITIRGERFVIPVKSEVKRRVQGVIHGASSSGQTVYLEPLETIELNNDLVRLLEDEQAEIHRIFLAMTRQIAGYAPVIGEGAAVLVEVETLLVRARFAQEYECVRPRFGEDSPIFELKNSRHPLLEKRLRASNGKIVPLSLGLSTDERQLIISGPNTGGKTVSLKTAGLLSIMAQAGIPVPAENAVFPVFKNILADIGDSQSIEQNLSTFSAHIVNLNRIGQVAGSESLVLLDELGSATDPEEGAALAVAVAGHFL